MAAEQTPGSGFSEARNATELPQVSTLDEANATLRELFGFLPPIVRKKNKGRELEVFLPIHPSDENFHYIRRMLNVGHQLQIRGMICSTELRAIVHKHGKDIVTVGYAFDVAFAKKQGK
jgi:hypothetical protein